MDNLSEKGLFFQVCRTPAECESAKESYQTILGGLGKNIIARTGKADLGRPVQIFLTKRRGETVGGIVGYLFGGWLYIQLFWVEESLRNKGYGTKLLRMIEDEAIKSGCKHAHVDTYSFEARPFYEKHGYTLFATLENYPEGYSKHFLKKKLL